jgi:hypothetical protein
MVGVKSFDANGDGRYRTGVQAELAAGRADIAAAQGTATPERRRVGEAADRDLSRAFALGAARLGFGRRVRRNAGKRAGSNGSSRPISDGGCEDLTGIKRSLATLGWH